ncbi:hypothetical protein RNJ44_02239 [Nakaseomyces bracarensis]|uniref:PI31 proteasome regulator C-terminal domain-containing protein n=1 Tax=Nakaseomyces bracarensis TaxID=273131 RepID=A0ABR4NMY0_9SACH
MTLQNNIEFAISHVVEYLNKVVNLDVEVENWTKSEVQRVSIRCRSSNAKYGHLNIVGVETIPKQQCLISFLTKDDSLAQFMLNYKIDLLINEATKYPLDYEEYIDKNPEEFRKIMDNISTKIEVKAIARQFQQDLKATDQSQMEGYLRDPIRDDPLRLPTAGSERRLMDDRPGFDDEYEIQRQRNEDLRPGGSDLGNYGDRDLYPTGNRYPDLNNPGQMPGLPDTSGGMIFDPFSGRNQQGREPAVKPPGWMPGAKFDDPYGRPPPSFPGSGFGQGSGFGSGSGGFGSGGFI